MGFVRELLMDITTGSWDRKIAAGTAVVSWFAMGAFFSSVLAYYLDLATSAQLPEILGGVLTAAVAIKVA
jgi:hypothetical protein